mgnify:CR=1 FL=1
MKIKIDPAKTKTADLHQYLLGSVAPRPIAFVSTVDKEGNANLAPYSFFNAFSSNPPMLVFSSNRKVADNTTKDTLHNVRETDEVVINVVNHAILRQMALSSVSYESGVSEFEKSGLTPVPSDLVKPFRVKESPVNMECVVKDVITLGYEGGAGHLIICEVVRMHVSEDVLDENKKIDPHKIDLMGRMGRAFYTRASGDSIMKVFQPVGEIPIGYDKLPEHIKNSNILSANDIARLAGLAAWPTDEKIKAWKDANGELKGKDEKGKMKLAKEWIGVDQVEEAFILLVC